MDALEKLKEEFRNTSDFTALILMGSYGCDPKLAKRGSDLDLFCLTNDNSSETIEKLSSIVEKLWPNQILLSITLETKFVVYLKLDTGLLKLDLSFGSSINDQARYLRGSEGCNILVNKGVENLQEHLDQLMSVKAHQCLPEYKVQWHVDRFLEMFELLCKSTAQNDAYRAEFHGNLVRHDLVVMEQILFGQNQHLYLPKNAFDKGSVRNLNVFCFKDQTTFWETILSYKTMFMELCNKLHIDEERVNSYVQYLNYVFLFYNSTDQ